MGHNPWGRLCPLDNIENERIYIAPEEFIPDGTAGATFTDDTGTDGTAQFNTLMFNGAADAIVFWNTIVPANFQGSPKLNLYWYTTGTCNTTTTCVFWSTYVRSIAATDATSADAAGTICTGAQAKCVLANATRVRKLTVDLSTSGVEIDPSDYLQITLKRDVSQDGNQYRVYLVGAEFQYVKG